MLNELPSACGRLCSVEISTYCSRNGSNPHLGTVVMSKQKNSKHKCIQQLPSNERDCNCDAARSLLIWLNYYWIINYEASTSTTEQHHAPYADGCCRRLTSASETTRTNITQKTNIIGTRGLITSNK